MNNRENMVTWGLGFFIALIPGIILSGFFFDLVTTTEQSLGGLSYLKLMKVHGQELKFRLAGVLGFGFPLIIWLIVGFILFLRDPRPLSDTSAACGRTRALLVPNSEVVCNTDVILVTMQSHASTAPLDQNAENSTQVLADSAKAQQNTHTPLLEAATPSLCGDNAVVAPLAAIDTVVEDTVCVMAGFNTAWPQALTRDQGRPLKIKVIANEQAQLTNELNHDAALNYEAPIIYTIVRGAMPKARSNTKCLSHAQEAYIEAQLKILVERTQVLKGYSLPDQQYLNHMLKAEISWLYAQVSYGQEVTISSLELTPVAEGGGVYSALIEDGSVSVTVQQVRVDS